MVSELYLKLANYGGDKDLDDILNTKYCGTAILNIVRSWPRIKEELAYVDVVEENDVDNLAEIVKEVDKFLMQRRLLDTQIYSIYYLDKKKIKDLSKNLGIQKDYFSRKRKELIHELKEHFRTKGYKIREE